MTKNKLPAKVRALFLSDLHLGYWIAHGPKCLPVLNSVSAETIYLVGDVIDEVRLNDRWYWLPEFQQFVDRISELQRAGVHVIAMPGNHDPFLTTQPFRSSSSRLDQAVAAWQFLERVPSCIHHTLGGQSLWVLHGDQFDPIRAKRVTAPQIGSKLFDRFSRFLPPTWIFGCRWIFKKMITHPNRIEQAIVEGAKLQDVAGVIYGHLHRPELKREDQFVVANCGDWMEHRSFLAESMDGELLLFDEGRLVQRLRM